MTTDAKRTLEVCLMFAALEEHEFYMVFFNNKSLQIEVLGYIWANAYSKANGPQSEFVFYEEANAAFKDCLQIMSKYGVDESYIVDWTRGVQSLVAKLRLSKNDPINGSLFVYVKHR